MLNGGLTIIRDMIDSLTPSEQKVADYILREPDTAVVSTVADIAKHSGTSEAAVIRLCKSLEFKGFHELKLRIAGDLNKVEIEEYRDFSSNDSVKDIISKVSSNNIQAIRETIEVLNEEEMVKAVNHIEQADRIIIYGVGASSIIAQDFQQKFSRIGKNCITFTDFHLIAVTAVNAGPKDVIIGVSYSGETQEVIEVLELARRNKATTISLTKYGKSPLTEQADIRLYTPASIESSFRSAATSSRITQLNVVDILFISVASRMYDKTVEYLTRTRQAVEARKIRK